MNKFVFTDGTKISCLNVMEGSEYYDNANRRVLTVYCPRNAITLDSLDAILSDESKLAVVKHENTDVLAEDIFNNYKIKMEIGVKPVQVGEDEDGMPEMEEQIAFKLGRLTPIEIKLAQLSL